MALLFKNLCSLCFQHFPSSNENKTLLAFREKNKVLFWYQDPEI